MTTDLIFLMVVFSLMLFIGCGGGSGSGGSIPPDPDPVSDIKTHYGSLAVGDLIEFKYDAAVLEKNPFEVPYSYKVIEGLNEGKSHEGFLKSIATSLYRLFETELGNPLLISPDVVIGMPEIDFGLFVGLPSLSSEYTVEDIVGVYNFVQYLGTPGSPLSEYKTNYGTIHLIEDGSWELAVSGDLSNSATEPTESGTWIDQGNGILHALNPDGRKIANIFINPRLEGDPQNKLLVMDVCSTEALAGVRLGVNQVPAIADRVEGQRNAIAVSSHKKIAADLSEEKIGISINKDLYIQDVFYNNPWNGFVSSQDYMVLPTWGGVLFGGTRPDSTLDTNYFAGIED